MLFNSPEFLLFLFIVFSAFYLVPQRLAMVVMLVASIAFYAFYNVAYLVPILFCVSVNFWASVEMQKARAKLRVYLWIAVGSSLAVLFYFKYANYVIGLMNGLLPGDFKLSLLDIVLPMGISFYTFQALSYSIDVYKGRVEPEKNFFRFLLFVSYWPQLVAGPIERAKDLLPQLRQRKPLDYPLVVSGCRLILYGAMKKVVVADSIAGYVDLAFSGAKEVGDVGHLLAIFLFGLQIYCDFSGYSDMAIGISRLFGVKLSANFAFPYFSVSLTEFWKRWHITLSNWFRDYVYIPLGGNRVSAHRHYLNLLITFAVSGVWHGANVTFLAWGSIHGLFLVAEVIFKKAFVQHPLRFLPKGLLRLLGNAYVLFIVMTAWLFFRAPNFASLTSILRALTDRSFSLGVNLSSTDDLLLYLVLVAGLLLMDLILFKQRNIMDKLPKVARYVAYVSAIELVVYFYSRNSASSFIYFTF